MPLRTAFYGDSDNVLLRKFLENQTQVINGTLTFKTTGGGGAGTPGGADTQFQYNNGGAFGGTTASYNDANGVLTFPSSVIRTPATVAAGNEIDITKSYSQETTAANETLTFSAVGTSGQFFTLDLINSDTASHAITLTGCTPGSFTAAASSTTTLLFRSTGAAWVIVGGAPTINDLTTVTPAAADLVQFWDTSGGVTGKATLANLPSALGLGTGDSPQFTAVNVGDAGDTTLTRVSAGVLAVESVTIPSISSTNTLTNKRITLRIATLTDAATVTPATDSFDGGILTTLSQATLFADPTGTPTDGQRYALRIKSTTARALTYGSQFRGSVDLALPAQTSGSSLTDYFVFSWDVAGSKWDIIGKNFGF